MLWRALALRRREWELQTDRIDGRVAVLECLAELGFKQGENAGDVIRYTAD